MEHNAADSQPLVSCLCVTRNKPDKLKRAIDCFLAQTHPHKELLIVYEGDDLKTTEFLRREAAALPSCVVPLEIPANPKTPLGELRNISIANCKGDYFCQWDDDDWYHAERLTTQLRAVLSNGQDACILTNWVMFDELRQQAYVSKFRLWEGSVLCRVSVVSEHVCYPPVQRSEDTFFTNFLLDACCVYPLTAPHLYVYTIHGGNTWPRQHFDILLAKSHPLSASASAMVADILSGRYSVAEGSVLLQSNELFRHVNYLRHSTINTSNENLIKWITRKQ